MWTACCLSLSCYPYCCSNSLYIQASLPSNVAQDITYSVNEGMMAKFGCIQEFQPESESITTYFKWLHMFLTANCVAEDKWVSVLLNVISMKTCSLLCRLLTPKTPKNEMFGNLEKASKVTVWTSTPWTSTSWTSTPNYHPMLLSLATKSSSRQITFRLCGRVATAVCNMQFWGFPTCRPVWPICLWSSNWKYTEATTFRANTDIC